MRSLTIGKKLYLAFGIVVLLMMIMGGVSIYRMNHITATYDKLVSTYQKIGYEAKDVKAALLSARRYEKDFIERHDRTYVERMDKTIEGMKADLNGMTKDCAALGLDDVGKNLKIALKAADSYYGAFGEMTTLIMAQGDEGTGIQGNLRKLSDDLEGAVKQTGSTDLTLLYLLLRKHENDYLLLKDEQYVEKAGKVVKTMDNMLKFMEPEVAAGIKKVSHAYLAVLGDFAANIATVSEQYAVMRQAALDIENGVLAVNTRIDEIVAAKMKEVHVSKDATLDELYILCGLVLLTGIVLSWYAVRSITRPVARAVAGLNRGSEQVASAANQVSAASQQLAEGASDQAASIEETSSSLEEMASMTRQNAEHANQADALMKDTNIIVAEANRSMDALTVSMEDISRASDETSKIIKTIDEIAFQTNLLALNAAVEAARAGEAGAGFAVVADEVRNLAMRAADAAKNTSTLIEDTVSKIAAGSQLVAGTNASFDKVALSSEKVAALISEISSASSEQSQGISQINRAVTEMDKIVQQNATNAEASAEASQAMNAQAGHMKAMVEELTALIKREVMAARPRKAKTVGRPAAAKGGIGCAKRPLSATASPEKVIPLDDDREDF